jgi:hypothetical protein
MDEYIKQSIEGRKNAIGATYEVSTEMQKKIDALFEKIEKFGAKCKDVSDFESKFATDSLNQEDMNLFTEIATGAVNKRAAGQVAESMAGGVVEGMARNALGNVVPTRASARQAVDDTLRKTPVVGDVIDISQKAGYVAHLGKLFGGRKKKKD